MVLAALGLLVVWPLGELFAVAFDGTVEQLDFSGVGSAVNNTLLIGSMVSVATVLLGVAAAFLTERSSIPGRRWLRLGILLPLLVPPFVSALSWARAYGPGGLSDDVLGLTLPGLFGLPGIAAVIAVNAMPLAYLLTGAALRTRIDPDLERAARVSGAGTISALRNVTLRLLTPALVGVAALVFVFAINAFGVPAILGSPSGLRTITTRIYEDFALSARPEAFRRAVLLAGCLVLIALLFVSMAEFFLSRNSSPGPAVSASGPIGRPTVPMRFLTVLVWLFVVFATIVPMLALILSGLNRAVGLAPVPSNWTLANFVEALDGRLFASFGRSVGLALLAATIAITLGGAVAALGRRSKRFAGIAVLLGFAIPGSTLAVAMILAYGRFWRDTLFLILIAYVAKLWAVGHRAVDGSAGQIAPHLQFAARVSGAGPITTLRTVTLPLLRPALMAGWVLVFMFSFHELTMSSLLYGPGTETLAVSVLNIQQLGDGPLSSALAVILTVPLLLAALPLLASRRVPGRMMGTG